MISPAASAQLSSSDPVGLAAATATAMLWAVSTIFYARAGARMTAPWLNFVKGVISCLLFALVLVMLGRSLLGPISSASAWPVFLLAISGFIGIAVGDTAYFACIREVGARNAGLLSLLAVPAASAGGLVFLGERLPPLAWVGIAVTLAGIVWVISERRENGGAGAKHWMGLGLLLGVIACICQAVGAILNRSVVRGGEYDDLWVAAWRLFIATVSLTVFLPFFARRPAVISTSDTRFWRYIIPATLMGTFGGMWLQQVAFARADAGYVQTLLSTMPIWMLPLAMMTGERVSWRAAIGSLVGLGGIVLLVMASRG